MKIRFGNFWLSPGGLEDVTSGLQVNGQQVNDRFDFYRAIAAVFQPRGNRSTALRFSVSRSFDTLRLAERFFFSQLTDLAQQDTLYFELGVGADTEWARLDGAVVEGIQPMQIGRSITTQYAFSAGLPVFDSPPPTVVEPTSSMIARSTTAIANGAQSVAVTFSTPFGSMPVVVPSVSCPAGSDVITCSLRKGSVSVAGFTADLSAPVPNANYELSWIASA